MPKATYSESKGLFQQSGTGLHLTVDGTAPTIALVNNSGGGAPAAAIEAQSTDVAGIINVTTQLENTDTLTITWDTAYDTLPVVVVRGLANYKYVTSATTCEITATGNTGVGELHYIAMRSV